MDRSIFWTTALLRAVDLLQSERNTMVAIGKVIEAVAGTSTVVSGLPCTPTQPASLSVQVGEGQIWSQQQLDPTAYSSLAADTTDLIMKQGLLMEAVTLSCPAPTTVGYSINYLIEATFAEADASAVVLSYFNSANPSQPYSGPNNTGTSNYTQRQDLCQVQVKAGTAATTGSQTTPTPDGGYVGLWVVTVAYGQSTITSGNISVYPGAPFISQSGAGPASAIQGRLLNVQVFTASGTYMPTPGTNKARVTTVGGGGSGGGVAAPTTGNCAGSSGGSSGSSIQVLVTSGFAGATVTVGAGGAAPTGGANGNSGGASSFGAFATAPGGPGGVYNGASSPGGWTSDNLQASAPTFSGCSLIFSSRGGWGGASSSFNSALAPRGGNGGASLFGAGAGGSANGAGSAALNYGAGGSGASANSGSGPFNGGAGMGGIVIIEEFA